MKIFLLGVLLFIIGLTLCVSLALSQEQTARMSLGIIGGGVPAAGVACTTSNDSQLTAFGTTLSVNIYVTTTEWNMQSFISSGTTWTLTEYSLLLYDGTGKTFTVSLYNADEAHKPTTEISGTTATATGVPGAYTETKLTLGTPKTGLSASTEFVVVLRADGTAYAKKDTVVGAGSGYYGYSADSGATWINQYGDLSSLVGLGIYGCN